MDLINRQDAIDDLHGKDPSQIWDTADIEVWLNALPSAQQWIPCSERIPEVRTSYLITRNGRIEIAYYDGNDLWRGLQGLTAFKTDSVSAWCELPKPYRGGQE